MRKPHNSFFFRYCLVGGLGFIVDALLLLASMALGAGPYSGRIISIACALFVTWLVHRRFTFKVAEPPNLRELLRYYVANAIGALTNYIVYSCLLAFVSGMSIIVAIAVSSAIALVVNYVGAKVFVFRIPVDRRYNG